LILKVFLTLVIYTPLHIVAHKGVVLERQEIKIPTLGRGVKRPLGRGVVESSKMPFKKNGKSQIYCFGRL